MRFKPLKNLTLGKSKEKPETDQDRDEFKAIAANRIADMEKRIHTKTKDLEAKVQEIQGLSPKSDEGEAKGDIPRVPHGPIGELTLDTDEKPDDGISFVDITDDDESEEEGEEIKLVEVKASKIAFTKEEEEKPAGAGAATEKPRAEADGGTEKPAKKEGEIKLDDSSDSLNNLFSNEEEEENPLANLINSLPDVTAQELIDDIAEIKGIIKEWQKK